MARPDAAGPVMVRRRGRRLTRNQKFAAAAVAAGLLLALAHGRTPPPADTASAPAATASAPPAASAGCGGGNETLANCMAAADGWTGSQTTCLDWLWTRESNFQTGATNPQSGAYGIPQSLPAAKMAAAGADWQTNPATQIRWGLGVHRRHLQHTLRRVEPRTSCRLVLTRARMLPIHAQARIVPGITAGQGRRICPETFSPPQGGIQVTKAELITAAGGGRRAVAADPVHRPEVLARGRGVRGRLLPRHSAAGSQISDLAARILATFGH